MWTHSYYDSEHRSCTSSSRTNSKHRGEGRNKMLPTSQKAISFSGLQSQAESVFIKELTPDALTTPQYKPYSQGYLGNINWTLQGKREKKKFQIWVGRHRKVDLMVVSECTMYTMHEIFKKLIKRFWNYRGWCQIFAGYSLWICWIWVY